MKIALSLYPMMTSVIFDGTCIVLGILWALVERVNGIDLIQQDIIKLVTIEIFNIALLWHWSQLRFFVNMISLVTTLIWFC